jgi:hypothetical protein
MHLHTRNVQDGFHNIVWGMHTGNIKTIRQGSRDGEVIRIKEPVLITYSHPTERVLSNIGRDMNPFFALFESLWMLAGRNDVAALSYYNSRITNYSDDGRTLNGAYGYRWRFAEHWNPDVPYPDRTNVDQIQALIKHLKGNKESRRAVLQMWDVENDLVNIETSKDVCCNTEVMLDIRDEHLNLTVINRSNDLLWGTFGNDYVCFSILQEYFASNIGVEVGQYHHFSNNMHAYLSKWEPEKWLVNAGHPEIWQRNCVVDYGNGMGQRPAYKSIKLVYNPAQFDKEVIRLINDNCTRDGIDAYANGYHEPFMLDVACPMLGAFKYYKLKAFDTALRVMQLVRDDAWREVGKEWILRRINSKRSTE